MEPSKKMDPPGTLQANPPLKLHPDRGAGTSVFVPEQGGYKERFVKTVEDKYKCEKCRLVLCNPKQTECGHRFCETCMAALLSSSSPKCTACQEGIIKDKVFKDNCCKREILALQIYCRNEGGGCTEQLTLGHLLVHLKNDCQFEELSCVRADCKEKVLRRDLRDHVEKACKYREATCSHCKSQVPMITLQKHEDTECPCVVVSCPHKCSVQTLLRSELSAHLSECVNAPSTCSFKRYGCVFQGTNQQIKAHEASSAVQHVNLLKEWSNSLEKKMRSDRRVGLSHIHTQVRQREGPLQQRCKVCVRRVVCDFPVNTYYRSELTMVYVSLLQNESVEKNKSIQSLHNQICSFEIEIERQKEMLRNNESKILHLQRVIDSQAEKLKELDKEIRPFRQNWEEADSMKSSVESLQNRVTELESVDKSAGQVARNTGLLESQLSRHDQMLSVHDIRLADMDLRFQVLETASYNGVLIWKIRDYKRRKQEAVMGKTLSLYSQPFYTGYFGYKMCARVYLNGDGMGKGTHLSLFFVIMRGEYDALLPWPFKQKVTLMLMDQGSSRRHLGDAFKPDPNSSSFKKPTGEMNIASGCPVFVAQTVLENGTYIKDDTIFIKVIVDTSDLPDP
ncbi:TNF receptor-associated factor 3 isoform X2 [Ursus arctos]|nr:TNF receptor-associated factor 3 isoform X2 [Ursus arctos]XP_057174515.1 TNF receptor-associated factor 3 isoform X2 [Ursus arctos]XP_057174517.1 TNF receptor-associated factor 3 isoform X2 [Ursus arctos]XP_057174518.1 TNF receptor-associated factor 3 isoform X2 [Ursus arctos]XP_057174519.1 TNF receptor-associated factor 3 isoform X2 [Ursus arctos]